MYAVYGTQSVVASTTGGAYVMVCWLALFQGASIRMGWHTFCDVERRPPYMAACRKQKRTRYIVSLRDDGLQILALDLDKGVREQHVLVLDFRSI